jgi:hypothetical protein
VDNDWPLAGRLTIQYYRLAECVGHFAASVVIPPPVAQNLQTVTLLYYGRSIPNTEPPAWYTTMQAEAGMVKATACASGKNLLVAPVSLTSYFLHLCRKPRIPLVSLDEAMNGTMKSPYLVRSLRCKQCIQCIRIQTRLDPRSLGCVYCWLGLFISIRGAVDHRPKHSNAGLYIV